MSAEIHSAETGRDSAETRETVAESTMKFDWLVAIKGNLDAIFADDPNVFVAGANLICANAYDWKETIAPSVYVAFGRPKKKRGQYKVWTERGIFPQVVFEVRWLGTNEPEMMAKCDFYGRYGAEELYVIDPDYKKFEVWLRDGDRLDYRSHKGEFVSPRLRIRFDGSNNDLVLYRPDGQRFSTYLELNDRTNRLAAKLRSLGFDPAEV